jgi:hypothetical protein
MTELGQVLEKELRSQRAEIRDSRVSRFGSLPLAWLALPPFWTGEAAAAAEFPLGKTELEGFLLELEKAGLCERESRDARERASWYRAQALAGLVPRLSGKLLGRALEALRELEDPWELAEVLIQLAPHLNREGLRQVLPIAAGIEEGEVRAEVLVALAPHLPSEVASNAVALARDLPRGTLRARFLCLLAPRLPEDLRPALGQQVLDLARELEPSAELVEVLAAALPRSTPEPRQGASDAVRVFGLIKDEAERARAFPFLEPLLDAGGLVSMARDSLGDRDRASALAEVAGRLPDEENLRLLDEIAAQDDEPMRARLLAKLLPHLPAAAGEPALSVVRSLRRDSARARVLAAWAPSLPAELAAGALEIARSLHDAGTRTAALAALGPRLGLPLRYEALVVVGEIRDGGQRARALRALVKGAPEEFRSEVLAAALASARTISDDGERVAVLVELAPLLPEEELLEVAEATLTLPDPGRQILALASVLERLSPGLVKKFEGRALRAVREIHDVGERLRCLVRLIPALPERRRKPPSHEALELVAAIGDPEERSQALYEVAQVAAESCLEEALDLVEEIRDDVRFWMPSTLAEEVLEDLREREGPEWLRGEAGEIGARLLGVRAVPLALRRWAEVASRTRGGLGEAARWLIQRVRTLIAAGETGQALDWVRIGESLAGALAGELESAVLLGQRGLELAYRAQQDERHLARFLERREQIDKFFELLDTVDDPEGPWALHYVGMGGVGKTMLIRYISWRVRERGLAASRIDFDHVNPDYPVRRPGQLLSELAAELRTHATTSRMEGLFEELVHRVVEFHEALSGEPPPEDPLANVRRPELERVLTVFADALRLLPRPVVLVLDTCEELAKVQPAGGVLPNVEATFEILERLHAKVPSLRVVFAGRRLLTRQGRGWHARPSNLPEVRSYLPRRKDYLELHEIRGFDGPEARDYLHKVQGISPAAQLEQAILERSLETGALTEIVWDREPARQESETRYNPFDLSLYADWLRRDPGLTIETLASDETDPYVEMRIVRRIRHAGTRKALPAVTVLRRFDREMLRLALPDLGSEELEEVYQRLSDQEWIDYQVGGDGGAFLEVDRRLAPRLYEFYRQGAQRGELETAIEQLAPALAEKVRSRPLAEVGMDALDAALRLVPEGAGARLWEDVERRIPEQADWSWALNVCGRLLGEEGAVDRSSPLRAAVLATHTAALVHLRTGDLTSAWAEVAETAGRHPDPEIARWLAHRAAAGRVAGNFSPLGPNEGPVVEMGRQLGELSRQALPAGGVERWRHEQLVAAYVAAFEDQPIFSNPSPPRAAVEALLGLGHEELPVDLRAFVLCLKGRILALRRQWKPALDLMRQAEAAAAEEGAGSAHRWSDWRAPDSLLDRVRLEMACVLPQRVFRPDREQLRTWRRAGSASLRTIDGERLASKILELRLRDEVPPEDDIEELFRSQVYHPDRRPRCHAHRVTPPLFTTLSLAFLAIGRPETGLELLDTYQSQAIRSGRDEDTVRAAERTRLRILRRLRRARHDPGLVRRLGRSEDPQDRALAWALRTLDEQAPRSGAEVLPGPEAPREVHAWWSTCYALGPRTASSVVTLGWMSLPAAADQAAAAEDGVLAAALELDIAELTRINKGLRVVPDVASRTAGTDLKGLWNERPDLAPELAALLLRRAALGPREEADSWLAEVPVAIGLRRTAELALEEGELVALRLPREGLFLLEVAREWFERAGDVQGRALASIRHLVALIHAGDDEAEEALARHVRPGYEALASRETIDLLPWNDMVSFSRNHQRPEEKVVARLQESTWSGWMLRLLGCLIYLEPPRGWGSSKNEVLKWLREPYGGRLPAEMNLKIRRIRSLSEAITYSSISLQADDSSALQEEKEEKEEKRKEKEEKKKRDLDWLWNLLFVLIFLLIVAGLLVGGYFLLGWVIGKTSPQAREALGTGGQVLLYLSLLVSPFVARSLRNRIRSALTARGSVRLEITARQEGDSRGANSAESEIGASLRLRLERWKPGFGWPLIRRTSIEVESEIRTPGIEPYDAAAKRIPGEIAAELAALHKRLKHHSLSARLVISPSLAHLPWEALLALAAPQDYPRRLRFWRATRTQFTVVGHAGRIDEVRAICGRQWASLVEGGWAPALSVRFASEREAPDDLRPGQILHLVGTAIRTSGGLHLQIGTDRDFRFQEMGWGAARGGLQLGSHELPFQRLSLVVLQGVPASQTGRRLATEREQAAELRAYAEELTTAGAPAVIVLPSVSHAVAGRTLSSLAWIFKGKQLNLRLLLDAVERAHLAISVGSRERPEGVAEEDWTSMKKDIEEAARELALDVCLSASRDLSD